MFFNLSDLDASPRMLGWHYAAKEVRAALAAGRMLHLVAETSNRCNLNCSYCYTVSTTGALGDRPTKRRLAGELTLKERLQLIDRAAELGARTYDVVGAGEPFLDTYLIEQIEYAVTRGLQPVIFTNGSRLGHPRHGPELVRRLNELHATVVVKHHGPAEVHDSIVNRRGSAALRDRAIARLIEAGFNAETPTRLGIDNIVFNKTLANIPDCLRWCRTNNAFLVCSSFIPAGRTHKADEHSVSWAELKALYAACRRLDAEEFGLIHSGHMPFIGSGATCTQYLGLYVTILGDIHGCVGKMENYDNLRSTDLARVWHERVKLLQNSFDGGCPPRQAFYKNIGTGADELKCLF